MSHYHQILGIANTANEHEIKSAYRHLALQFHPDKNPSPEAAQRFNEINEAYTMLMDSEQSNHYEASTGSDFQEVFQTVETEEDEQFKNDYYRKYHRWPGQPRPQPRYEAPASSIKTYSKSDLKRSILFCYIVATVFATIILDGILPKKTTLERINYIEYKSDNYEWVGKIITDNHDSWFSSNCVPSTFVKSIYVQFTTTLILGKVTRISHFEKNVIAELNPSKISFWSFFPFLLIMLTIPVIGLIFRKKETIVIPFGFISIIFGFYVMVFYLNGV